MSDVVPVVAGVDTHKDVHVLCVLDGLGRQVFTGSFQANEDGYNKIAAAIGDPKDCIVVGIEGTASYGAGLARRLTELGFEVVEVLRPKRDKRRRGTNKNDMKDAERAARDAIAGNGTSIPKTQDGWVEAVRFQLIARRLAVKTSTSAINTVKSLINTAPEHIRNKYSKMSAEDMMSSLQRKRSKNDELENAVYSSLRSLSLLWAESRTQADDAEKAISALLIEHAPALLNIYGCGTITAATLAVTAGDNPDRMGSESAFAALCGVSPVEASSGKTVRHRLNRGGNRQANCALYQIALTRMQRDKKTKTYVDKRMAEGKSKPEIIRCLKRYIAKEIYRALLNPSKTDKLTGAELKESRTALGFSQTDIGTMLGVPSIRISEIERDIKSNLELRERYRQTLDRLAIKIAS